MSKVYFLFVKLVILFVQIFCLIFWILEIYVNHYLQFTHEYALLFIEQSYESHWLLADDLSWATSDFDNNQDLTIQNY